MNEQREQWFRAGGIRQCPCLSCVDLRLELLVNKVFAAIKVG